MTTINNLTIEQMREIVEGAPERAEVCIPCLEDVMYFAKRDDGKWFKWSNGYNQWLEYFGKVDPMDLALDLNDLRTAIVDHDREFKIGDHIRYMGIDRKSPHPEIFEVVGFDSMSVGGNGYKIKNRLGQIDFCYGDNYALVDCDNTDHVTDIRNHVSPSTKVVDL